jgi:hypothetical protein
VSIVKKTGEWLAVDESVEDELKKMHKKLKLLQRSLARDVLRKKVDLRWIQSQGQRQQLVKKEKEFKELKDLPKLVVVGAMSTQQVLEFQSEFEMKMIYHGFDSDHQEKYLVQASDVVMKMELEEDRMRMRGIKKMWETIMIYAVGPSWKSKAWVELREMKQRKNESILKFSTKMNQYFNVLGISPDSAEGKVTLKMAVLKEYEHSIDKKIWRVRGRRAKFQDSH